MIEGEQPITTKDLYRQLVERAQLREARGEKTKVYKEFIESLSEETGEERILFQAVIAMLKKKYPAMKIVRPHVMSVIEHNWETSRDTNNNDLIWIDVSKPKTPRLTNGPDN